MASLNRVTLIGHLGADPEVRYTQNREAIATIRIATTETYKDKSSGERKETTEWHRIVFFNRMAEVVGEYLKKGSPIYVEGRIQTRKWQDQSGQERSSTEVVLQRFNEASHHERVRDLSGNVQLVSSYKNEQLPKWWILWCRGTESNCRHQPFQG